MNNVAQYAVAPQVRATCLVGMIREIDNAMKESNQQVTDIEARGILKNLFSSSSGDVVAQAKSQSRINDLLVKLNQEVLRVNTMGYAYLASVIANFECQVNEGSKDCDGRIHVLSANGKEVARAATVMFNAILDGSRSTQERIDANTAAVFDLDSKFADLALAVSEQSFRMAVGEEFRWLATSRLEEHALMAQRHSATLEQSREEIKMLLIRHDEYDLDRIALREEIISLRSDLNCVNAREVAIQQHLRLEEHALMAQQHSATLEQSREEIKMLLIKHDEYDLDRIALREEIISLRSELNCVNAREVAIRQHLRRSAVTTFAAATALAVVCVASARSFGLL